MAGNQVQQSRIGIIESGSLFHYDFSNTNTHSGQTVIDLSGNNNNGTIRGGSNIYYDNSENAFRFNGSTSGDPGVAINGIKYISGDIDKIENLIIQAKIKASSESTSDERIILSFDRSAVFRLSIVVIKLVSKPLLQVNLHLCLQILMELTISMTQDLVEI